MRRLRKLDKDHEARFLRSRGDAPVVQALVDGETVVPPLTRRCARSRASAPPRGRGSSAHAEMRPARRIARCRARRFLRSRGDAPARSRFASRTSPVPPLTRRCARPVARRRGDLTGSSAHAEMRRRPRARPPPRTGFLRSRGDAPYFFSPEAPRAEVPPLTRRCARVELPRRAGDHGSSAHAEMRRSISWPACARRWFLRSRGDAPGILWRDDAQVVVPPLTRRCAGDERLVGPRAHGSSAHAEMRRAARRGWSRGRGFLRSRGDAPACSLLPSACAGVPPLTRRCAVRACRDRAEKGGSSAHAEMRPFEGLAAAWDRGFLRSRGDAPCRRR